MLGSFKTSGNIDHIAIESSHPSDSAEWYSKRFGGRILYKDLEWALVGFENINLAFVVPGSHPPHIAFKVNYVDDTFGEHRDGSMFKYAPDDWGNIYELIYYNKKGG